MTLDFAADFFLETLRTEFGFTPTPELRFQTRRALMRVGPQNYNDLIASVLLDCWECRQSGECPCDQQVFIRSIWRITKAILRDASRLASVKASSPTQPTPLPRPDTVVSNHDLYKRAMDAVGELGDIDRLIIDMWMSECSPEDTSRATGLSVEAVRKRRSRAWEHLRQKLGQNQS